MIILSPCGSFLLTIRLVYHVCMVEVYELEDFFGFLRAQSGNVCDVGVAKSCRPMIHSEHGLIVSWDW